MHWPNRTFARHTDKEGCVFTYIRVYVRMYVYGVVSCCCLRCCCTWVSTCRTHRLPNCHVSMWHLLVEDHLIMIECKQQRQLCNSWEAFAVWFYTFLYKNNRLFFGSIKFMYIHCFYMAASVEGNIYNTHVCTYDICMFKICPMENETDRKFEYFATFAVNHGLG